MAFFFVSLLSLTDSARMFFANEWLQSSVRSSGENIYRSPAQGIVTSQNKLMQVKT